MSEKAIETLTKLNKEGKLIVEIKEETTILFIHKDTGVLLLKREHIGFTVELLAMWGKY